ncbi:glutamate receptor ionotropic, delta-2-like [Amphibalanus amphitrite]|uniref:glutamate receptor ionotropic, delta-2-like n=1 Tax=Amphibalanus amphitrite TaxID=1232801 RepID=UPI001C9187D7|nr:glutamate receptor ionotropic, delta-2-like [Amphibalanus amphitrite]
MEKLPNGELQVSGFLGTLLSFLEERLNFRAEIHVPERHILKGNLTAGGMLGNVYKRQLEIGLASFAIVEERRALVDFTPHIESTHHSFLIRDPTLALPDDEVNWTAYLAPFGRSVWLALLGVAVLAWLAAGATLWLLSGPVDTRSSAADSAWIVTGTVLQQGTGLQPNTLSARQALICLWMLTMLLYTAYTSNIVSLLASNRFAMPFSTLQELKNLKDWKILIRENGFEYQFLQKLQTFESRRYMFIDDLEAGIDRVLQGGKYVLFSPVANIEATVEADCRLIWAPIKLAYSRGHAILQKDLPYGDRISNAIQVLGEAGIIAETWRKETEAKRLCTETNALPAMSLRHTLPAFALLLLGLLISAAVLAAERLWRRSDGRSRQYRQRHQLAQRCPSVIITSPEPIPPPRHLTAGRDCHLAADDRTTAAPLFDWPVSSSAPVRYLSTGSGRPSSHSADSTVTDAEVPQHHVQVLVHRRLASAAGRGSAVGWTDGPGPGDVPSTVPDPHRDGA